jgi:hypothetical protein
LFVIAGELQVNGETLRAGDQARVSGESALQLAGPAKLAPGSAADFLLLDLP